MLTKLQKLFDQHLGKNIEKEKSLELRLQLASAALMVEMLYVDERITADEEGKLQGLLEQRFKLNEKEIEALIELAYNEKKEAIDYYAFTSILNEHYTQQQKIKLVEDLWQLAYADRELDKYEEHLLRRLSELLHVPHKDFIRTKHKALRNCLSTDEHG